MNKALVIKPILFFVLIGLFISQNIVLFSTLDAFITQKSIDAVLCEKYVQGFNQKYSNLIDTSFIIGLISLSISLVFIYFANIGNNSNHT